MIISKQEIDKCVRIISTGARGKSNKPVDLLPSERARLNAYRRRLEQLPEKPNEHLEEVKTAVEKRRYDVGSDEVAQKLLGRVISDKVR